MRRKMNTKTSVAEKQKIRVPEALRKRLSALVPRRTNWKDFWSAAFALMEYVADKKNPRTTGLEERELFRAFEFRTTTERKVWHASLEQPYEKCATQSYGFGLKADLSVSEIDKISSHVRQYRGDYSPTHGEFLRAAVMLLVDLWEHRKSGWDLYFNGEKVDTDRFDMIGSRQPRVRSKSTKLSSKNSDLEEIYKRFAPVGREARVL